MMDDWKLKATPVVRLKRSNDRSVYYMVYDAMLKKGQIFRIGTVRYAEGLWRMRRHGPVIAHCTVSEDLPKKVDGGFMRTVLVTWNQCTAKMLCHHSTTESDRHHNPITNPNPNIYLVGVGLELESVLWWAETSWVHTSLTILFEPPICGVSWKV